MNAGQWVQVKATAKNTSEKPKTVTRYAERQMHDGAEQRREERLQQNDGQGRRKEGRKMINIGEFGERGSAELVTVRLRKLEITVRRSAAKEHEHRHGMHRQNEGYTVQESKKDPNVDATASQDR